MIHVFWKKDGRYIGSTPLEDGEHRTDAAQRILNESGYYVSIGDIRIEDFECDFAFNPDGDEVAQNCLKAANNSNWGFIDAKLSPSNLVPGHVEGEFAMHVEAKAWGAACSIASSLEQRDGGDKDW